MDWLTTNLQEHSLVFIVVSTALGVFVGTLAKFSVDDVLAPLLGDRREIRRVVRTYTTPLTRSAESLERRINNLVRNRGNGWYGDPNDYYRLSTLYTFSEHLVWVHLLEREFGFLPYESGARGRLFQRRLNGLFRALTSHAYFRSDDAAPDPEDGSVVPRFMLRAIGEVCLDPGTRRPLAFTEFCVRFEGDEQFRRWFRELDATLAAADSHPPSAALDRVVAAGANLRALVKFLDPKARLVTSRPAVNLDLAREPARRALVAEFPDLVPHGVRTT